MVEQNYFPYFVIVSSIADSQIMGAEYHEQLGLLYSIKYYLSLWMGFDLQAEKKKKITENALAYK